MTEYIKVIENNPMKKAARISEDEYEIVEFYVPKEYRNKGIEEELLKKVTDDADNEGVTLRVDINNMMTKNSKLR